MVIVDVEGDRAIHEKVTEGHQRGANRHRNERALQQLPEWYVVLHQWPSCFPF